MITPPMIVIVLITITLLIFLIWSEKKSQDYLNGSISGKPCINNTPTVDPGDSPITAFDKLIETLRKNFTTVGWRRALIVALLAGIILGLFIRGGSLTGVQYTGIVVIIFLLVYLGTVFIQNQWWYPNTVIIEDEILKLRKSTLSKRKKSKHKSRKKKNHK